MMKGSNVPTYLFSRRSSTRLLKPCSCRKISVYIPIIYLCVFLLSSTSAFSQIRLSGFIKDASSGERLVGATILDISSKKGTSSDQQAFFSMLIKVPTKIQISFVGYTSEILNISSSKDTLVEIVLRAGQSLAGVEVKTNYRSNSNIVSLSTNEIMNIPSLSGKPDVLKAMQLMPGIRSQGEASSVTLVRGGNPGENLYLLDQTPLIYVHHIGGFMSVFNPDIINNVEIYKGAFPAKYGSKLSSVMNITQKEGDKSGLQGTLSVGVADLSFTLEGPTKLKNSSFIISGRKTLTELYYLLLTSLSSQTNAYLTYGFHDINGKFSWNPNNKNSLHFNVYQGDDYLQYFGKELDNSASKFQMGNIWGNWLVSANWQHVYSSDLFFNTTLSYTHYQLKNTEKIKISDPIEGIFEKKRTARSSLQDVSLRSDAKYLFWKNWNIDFGLKASYLRFMPVSIKEFDNSKPSKEIINASETVIYIDNKIRPFDKLNMDIGLRLVNYATTDFYHFSLEPRVCINFDIHPQFGLNASYMRVSQNAQLLYNTGSISANEIYIPSGKNIPVAISNQATFGFNTNFNTKMFEIEANVYYKTLQNLSTYKEGYNYVLGNIYWQKKIETGGSGLAKGFEFLFKKNKGKFTGFATYTFSQSTRKYAQINNGKSYLFEYDSPHCISLSVNYKINAKWSINASWQYQTGLPYTPVIGRYSTIDIDPNTGEHRPYEVLLYGEKNSARMRAYHRLDLGVKYTTITKKRHRKAEWTFSLYNAYCRQNPYYYYYNTNATDEIYNPQYWTEFKALELYQISMFSLIPMVSYKIWFGANSGENEKKKKKFTEWLFYE